MKSIKYKHDILPEHDCHLHRCEGCGKMQHCCEIAFLPVFGSMWEIPMCEDDVACGVRMHLQFHYSADPNVDCVYCMAGTNCPPEVPPQAFSMEMFAEKYGEAMPEPAYSRFKPGEDTPLY